MICKRTFIALWFTMLVFSVGMASDDENAWQESRIFDAAYSGNLKVVEAALVSGKNPNMRRPTYGSLLTRATVGKQLEMISLLLAYGADPKAKGNETLVFAAVETKRLEIVKCLVEAGGHIDSLPDAWFPNAVAREAVFQGCPEILEYLLKQGADPNVSGLCDSTAMQLAASQGSIPMLTMLVSVGAEVDHRDCNGKTALMDACGSGQKEVVEFLLCHGADPSLKDGYDRNAASFLSIEKGQAIEELRLLCSPPAKH
jgi:ankyrin repeat protein